MPTFTSLSLFLGSSVNGNSNGLPLSKNSSFTSTTSDGKLAQLQEGIGEEEKDEDGEEEVEEKKGVALTKTSLDQKRNISTTSVLYGAQNLQLSPNLRECIVPKFLQMR